MLATISSYEVLLIVMVLVLAGGVPAGIAVLRRRNPLAWFFIGILFAVLLASILPRSAVALGIVPAPVLLLVLPALAPTQGPPWPPQSISNMLASTKWHIHLLTILLGICGGVALVAFVPALNLGASLLSPSAGSADASDSPTEAFQLVVANDGDALEVDTRSGTVWAIHGTTKLPIEDPTSNARPGVQAEVLDAVAKKLVEGTASLSGSTLKGEVYNGTFLTITEVNLYVSLTPAAGGEGWTRSYRAMLSIAPHSTEPFSVRLFNPEAATLNSWQMGEVRGVKSQRTLADQKEWDGREELIKAWIKEDRDKPKDK